MNLTDLLTRGFVVVPGFLDSSDISKLLTDYQYQLDQYQHQSADNKNYIMLTSNFAHGLEFKIHSLLHQIRDHTNLQTDMCDTVIDYLDTAFINFGWHQDHETYYMWQNSRDTLNFWMPLIKSSGLESGVQVVPHDKLGLARAQIESRGATKFQVINAKYTRMIDDECGQETILPVNIDAMAETPVVNVGDVLLIRGDTVHRTQPISTPRVAASLKCTNSKSPVHRDKFFNRCAVKSAMIDNNPAIYQKITKAFESGQDQITVAEVIL